MVINFIVNINFSIIYIIKKLYKGFYLKLSIENDVLESGIILFKYLIYLFLLILSYKFATMMAVSEGFFSKDRHELVNMIYVPFYLMKLIPMLLIISSIFITVTYFFFTKCQYFKALIQKTLEFSPLYRFIFWISLGLMPYMSLSYFDSIIEEKRVKGSENRKKITKQRSEDYFLKIKNYTKEEALKAVRKDGQVLRLMSTDFQKDKEIVYAAVKQNSYAGLKDANMIYKKDRELILIAIKQNGSTLCMADKILRKDKQLALIALDATKHGREAFSCFEKSLKYDRDLVLISIKKHPSILRILDNRFKKDKEIVLEAVKKDGYVLRYAHSELKKDREIVLLAVGQSGYALEHIDISFKMDKEVIMTALKSKGAALKYASYIHQSDRDMVLLAVSHDDKFHDALKYASASLRDDKEIALVAVKHNGLALRHVSMRLKKDKEVVLVAIKQNKSAITYADKSLQEELK